MTAIVNPFGAEDADRREIWSMLVERDIEAFVARDWNRIDADFLVEAFSGIDAAGTDSPDGWRLAFPTLDRYRASWLDSAERLARRARPESIRRGLADATILRDIEIDGDVAVAHKKFDGEIALDGGDLERLRWQTLYTCRRVDGKWKILGFVGYLPNPMGTRVGRGPKARPESARQHVTAGPYSPVLEVDPAHLVVLSGQAAIAPDGSIDGDDVSRQTHVTLANCRRQLRAAGCDFADVFKVNVYLHDLADWHAFNAVYEPLMPEPRPVRTAVQAGLLPGLLVEVEMWAARG